MPHILEQSEQSIQRYLQMTGKTRKELEQQREKHEREDQDLIAKLDSLPNASPDEKMGQYIGFDVIGLDGERDGGDDTG